MGAGRWRRAAAAGVSAAMVAAACTRQADVGSAPPATPADAPAASKPAQQIAGTFRDQYRQIETTFAGGGRAAAPDTRGTAAEQLFSILDEVSRRTPRDTFDPAAIVAAQGNDPIKLFEWVRDRTDFVPYRGLLRGDVGVLMDRAGNSLDRAYLLYRLLRLAGHQARLAQATLSDAQAADVIARLRPLPAAGARPDRPSSAPASADAFGKVDAVYAAPAGTTARRATALADAQAALVQNVAARVSAASSAITAAVGARDSRSDGRTDAARAATDHWWVECEQGSAWVALDPTLPDAAAGRQLAEPRQRVAPQQLAEIGADNLVTLTLQVTAEAWHDGRLEEKPVLSRDVVPADSVGRRIHLQVMPVHWPMREDLRRAQNPIERFKSLALAQREWLPVLVIGDDQIFKNAMTDAGELRDMTAPGAGGIGEGAGNRVFDFMGQRRAGASQANAAGGALTAAWIDYAVRTPGEPVRTFRRELFDLLGPAARAAAAPQSIQLTDRQRLQRGVALIREVSVLAAPSQLSPEFVDVQIGAAIAGARGALLDLARGRSTDEQRSDAGRGAPIELYELALARQQWSPVRGDVYLDRLNLFSYQRGFTVDAAGGVSERALFDIVANDVAVRSGSKDPFGVRVQQGVVDTTAEAILGSAQCALAVPPAHCAPVDNASEAFAASQQQGAGWVAIRNAGDLAAVRAASPDAAARLERDLAAGYVVVVPKKSGAASAPSPWWRVDPRTGTVLGMGAAGGQSATEYYKLLATGVVAAAASAVCYLYPTVRADSECRGYYFDNGRMLGGYQDLSDCTKKRSQDIWDRSGKSCVVGAVIGSFGVFWGTTVSVITLLFGAAVGVHMS